MRIFRQLAPLFVLGLVFAFASGSALAAGNGAYTETNNAHGATDTFDDVVPCGSASLYSITVTYNEVDHTTVNKNSFHFTSTMTGDFVAVPYDTSATYTGHFTQWFNFNGNNQNAASGFTFSVHGTGSDGSTIQFNAVAHFNVTPGGVENSFSFENCH